MEALTVTISLLLRSLVAIWPHSGQSSPPMFGDFEAQRHWLEITTSLSIGDWYRNTTENDLQYWGLDYPPLTAYVSWFFGKIAKKVCPALVALTSSRGYEAIDGKSFMRASVILSDILLFLPAAVLLCRMISQKKESKFQNVVFMLSVLCSPALLIIDHGHFQYNGVSIGFTLLSVWAIGKDLDILGSIFFVLSLNFKQMTLYYSLAIFAILLRKCLIQDTLVKKIAKLAGLGVTVIASFALLWFPFCLYPSPEDTCLSSMFQVLHRLFPFARGIFEDKVANIWYALSVVYDYRGVVDTSMLTKLSILLTLGLASPSIYCLLSQPFRIDRALLGLMNVSLSFFLASFQVHEKSLLMCLVPASLLLYSHPIFAMWVQVFGTWTLFPLLAKDKLRIPYVVLQLLYIIFAYCFVRGDKLLIEANSKSKAESESNNQFRSAFPLPSLVLSGIIGISFIAMIGLHVAELMYKPPSHLPDLYPALFALVGVVFLGLFWLIGTIWLFLLGKQSIEKVKAS